MAQIELRDCTIEFRDGFSGTAAVNEASPANGDTFLTIDTIANLTNLSSVVPVGAHFTLEGHPDLDYTITDQDSNKVFHVVVDATSGHFKLTFNGQQTASIVQGVATSVVEAALVALSNVDPGDVVVTGSANDYTVEITGQYEGLSTPTLTGQDVDLSGGASTVTLTTTHAGAVTWKLTFSPALATATLPVDDDTITFSAQRLEVKIGTGDLTYTEKNDFTYELDRGVLDTVRENDDQPMEVSIDLVYEHITTGTSETISPMDALKNVGGAAGWVSSSSDQCEPYAIDLVLIQTAPCGTSEDETTVFTDFRSESRQISVRDATIKVTGKCNAVEPLVSRS